MNESVLFNNWQGPISSTRHNIYQPNTCTHLNFLSPPNPRPYTAMGKRRLSVAISPKMKRTRLPPPPHIDDTADTSSRYPSSEGGLVTEVSDTEDRTAKEELGKQ